MEGPLIRLYPGRYRVQSGVSAVVTRKVVFTGEVIRDAESVKFPGFFAFIGEDGERRYASNSVYSATKILQPGQRIEWVTARHSLPWARSDGVKPTCGSPSGSLPDEWD